MARRRARKSAARSGRQQGTPTKPHQPAPSHIDAAPSPQDESGRVRNGPSRSHKSFRRENNAHDSESDEQTPPSQSSTVDDSGDEEVGKHASAFDDHVLGSRAKHIRILSIAESETITVEELNMDDMFDFNNVLMPSRIQDASSDDSDLSDSGSTRSSLAADFENLQCDPDLTEEGFKKYCSRKSLQSRRRWRRGGNHKRHHDQTVGSGEEFEDVTPLDPPTSNPSRRLRRRTGEPQEKPGRSQILGDFEELFGTVSNVMLQNASGDYDEYLLSQWTFDSMVVDDSDGDAGDEASGNEDSGEEDGDEDASDEDSSDDSSDDDSSDDSSDSD